MSHFTVLVPAGDEHELEAMLLPYHEYECTGIEEYLEFVPVDMEKMQTDYEEHGGEYDSLEEFIPAWSGNEQNEEGVWGRITNPNAKWDWWIIGGRWTGLLQLKPGASGESGEPGIMTESNRDPTRADVALAGDVDWDAILQRQVDAAIEEYDSYHEIRSRFEGKDLEDEEAQKEYQNALWDARLLLTKSEEEELELSKDEYIKLHSNEALTFAFITRDDKWVERASMGWWAITTNPNTDYDIAFWEFVRSLPDDQRVYVVDCHI